MNDTNGPFGEVLIGVAAEWAGVTPDAITGRTQRLRPSMARQGIMFVLYTDQGWPLREIGELLNRNHSTIAKGQKRFGDLLPDDPDALDVAVRLRQIRPDGRIRNEIEAQRELAMAVIQMGRACREAIAQMEDTARTVLRVTEGYE